MTRKDLLQRIERLESRMDRLAQRDVDNYQRVETLEDAIKAMRAWTDETLRIAERAIWSRWFWQRRRWRRALVERVGG